MSLNQDQITAPLTPIARQDVRIIVSTKFRFQRTILRMFGPTRLAAINASVDPFILPIIRYDISFDVYIFVLF